MDNIIKQIRNIIGNHWSSELEIVFYGDSISFNIYEYRVPIVYNGKDISFQGETFNKTLTGDMLIELGQIIKVLEESKGVLKQFLYKVEGDGIN